MEIGDKVVKCKEDWEPNDFDSWGRGIGVGVIVEPSFELSELEFDVRCPGVDALKERIKFYFILTHLIKILKTIFMMLF